MQAAAFESTFPIMGGLTWQKTFHAMYATPVTPRDIVVGNLVWIALRLTMIAAIFTVVMALFGAAASPLILLGIPAAVLTGMAFAAPIAAFSATQTTPEKFNAVFRFGITPLFLFSGTFFPLSNLPEAIRPIAWLSPLWHGVELSRGLAFGTIGAEPLLALAHVAILVAIVAVGSVLGVPDRREAAGQGMTSLVAPAHRLFTLGSRRARFLVERNIYVYRHGWIVILSGFFEPLFYLGSIGFGLGALVGTVNGPGGGRSRTSCSSRRPCSRSAAMNGAIAEGTFNFFFKLRYNKTFDAILATPLSAGDVAVGELVWALIRGGIYAIAFLLVMAVLGLVVSPWVLLDGAGGAPDRLRVRRRRDGLDVVHADVAGLRPDPARRPADVPVLGHVLPARRVSGGDPGRRPADPALPGRRPAARARGRPPGAGRSLSTSRTSRSWAWPGCGSSRAGSTSSCSSRPRGWESGGCRRRSRRA